MTNRNTCGSVRKKRSVCTNVDCVCAECLRRNVCHFSSASSFCLFFLISSVTRLSCPCNSFFFFFCLLSVTHFLFCMHSFVSLSLLFSDALSQHRLSRENPFQLVIQSNNQSNLKRVIRYNWVSNCSHHPSLNFEMHVFLFIRVCLWV